MRRFPSLIFVQISASIPNNNRESTAAIIVLSTSIFWSQNWGDIGEWIGSWQVAFWLKVYGGEAFTASETTAFWWIRTHEAAIKPSKFVVLFFVDWMAKGLHAILLDLFPLVLLVLGIGNVSYGKVCWSFPDLDSFWSRLQKLFQYILEMRSSIYRRIVESTPT